MNNDIIDLLGLMEECVKEKYSGSDDIALYNKFIEAIEEVKEQLDLVDDLENRIDDLESEAEILREENESLENQVIDWKEDYQRLEREYVELAENS